MTKKKSTGEYYLPEWYSAPPRKKKQKRFCSCGEEMIKDGKNWQCPKSKWNRRRTFS